MVMMMSRCGRGRQQEERESVIDFEGDIGATRNVVDALHARARATLHNLANQNTPGYQAYRVRFEDLLRGAQQSGRDPGAVTHEIVRDTSGPPGVNNVSPMKELALLDKSRILADVFTRRARGYFKNLNHAIYGHR